MTCVELNPAGNFDPWDTDKISELKGYLSTSLGQDLLFENESVKLWEIQLEPGERLPFRVQNRDFSWTCLSDGLAITRNNTGKIDMLRFKKGDNGFWESNSETYIVDLENIGEDPFKINALEFKNLHTIKV